MNLRHIITSILFALAYAATAIAQDTVNQHPILINSKDGPSVCGIFVKADADTIAVDINGVQKTVNIDAITSIVFLPKKIRSGIATSGEIRVKQESQDMFFLYLEHMFVPANVEGNVQIAIFFNFSRQHLSGPRDVELHLFSDSSESIFHHDTRLTLLIDGERQTLGEMVKSEPGYKCNIYSEHTFISLPTTMFLNMAKAKQVEAQVGKIMFRLTDPQISTLREVIRLTNMESGPSSFSKDK